MMALFPFDLPAHGALYAVLYVASWSVHALLASYVLGGTAYVAAADLLGRERSPNGGLTVGSLLRDWLPFALGVAITAGVAPLLFVQILRKKAFYTANLLLFHGWMALLPVLIAGFYLLYAIKTKWYANNRKRRWWVSLPALFCMVFTAYSWTQNHLLSLQSQEQWATAYGGDSWEFWNPMAILRMLMWVSGALSVMPVLVAWQLYGAKCRGEMIAQLTPKHLSRLAITAIGCCAAATAGYCAIDRGWRDLFGRASVAYFALIAFAAFIQLACWIRTMRVGVFSKANLLVATGAAGVTMLSFGAIRECVRIDASQVDWIEKTRQAAQNGGLLTFLLFGVINAVVIIFLMRGIGVELANPAENSPDPNAP